ncbi:uncharacterized protein LOC141850876 [Brevipalpus obovatus]|uniref:uncharacterized protein LOC141850876 n=1 Tax=Brevipalpus obovatus TaxID=246614 RepID=UPI003D9EBE4C
MSELVIKSEKIIENIVGNVSPNAGGNGDNRDDDNGDGEVEEEKPQKDQQRKKRRNSLRRETRKKEKSIQEKEIEKRKGGKVGQKAKTDDRWFEVLALGGQQWVYRKSKKQKVLATEVFFRGNLLEQEDINCPRLKVKQWGFTAPKNNRLKFPEEETETDREKKRRLKRGRNPETTCRFCEKKFSSRDNAIRHERSACVAGGSPNHPDKCDTGKCIANCKGKVVPYIPPPPRNQK